MLDYIYQWMRNVAFYMVIMVAVMQMIPGNSYKKYIRFFVGMILILMLTEPVFKIFGMSTYQEAEYRKEMEKIEEAIGHMEEIIREEGLIGE